MNVLTTLYYAATWNPLNFPLELLSNGFTFLLPAADLLLNGRLKVRFAVVGWWLKFWRWMLKGAVLRVSRACVACPGQQGLS